jgi:L-iditol 2-dehydrogenase
MRPRRDHGLPADGGFAEYVIVPAAAIAAGGINRIPPHVGFAAASVTEPLACVLKGQERIGAAEGADVVVIGAGPICCLHVRLARARGAGRVFLVDVSRPRLGASAALTEPDAAICADGTDVTSQILELTGGRGADVVIVAAASGAAYEQALRMAARRGSVSYFAGLPAGGGVVALDAGLLHYRELSVTGTAGASPAHNTRALELIADGVVQVSDLITHRLPLGGLPEAIDIAAAGTGIKVTIEP